MKKLFYGSAIIIALFIAIAAVIDYRLTKSQTSTNSVKTAQTAALKPNPPTRAQLLALVNAERAKSGVAPLTENPILDKSAQWKANDEVTYKYFGHVKPGTTGNDGLDYLESIGSPCGYGNISENLAWVTNGSTETAPAAVNWWMSSTPHRTAMLNPKYTLTGFGISHSGVVEHFCRTQQFTTPTTVAN